MEMTELTDVNMVRCVLVGDWNSGKARMLKKYADITGSSYDPENIELVTTFNGHKCIFVDSSLSGNHLENAHVILICVSVACRIGVEEMVEMIEKRLIRTIDIDGRRETRAYQTMPLHRAESFAKRIGAVKYLECSEITGEGIEEVFESAFEIAYHYAVEQQKTSQRRKPSSKNVAKRVLNCIMQ